MRISICVATLQRQAGLERLVRAIQQLTFTGEQPALEVVIVDNDADGSARAICDDLRRELAFPLRYLIEPRRGIAFARNKGVESALEHADFVAFVDDDEIPERGWLDELIRVQRLYNADVVTGPVAGRIPEGASPWINRGRFFEAARRQTGQALDRAYTCNTLVRSSVFTALGSMFDERFALTGGEDTHFFRRVSGAGFKIVWAQGARVAEWIPSSRACFGWLVRRSFRNGTATAVIDTDLKPSHLTRMVIAGKAAVWILIGILVMPAAVVGGRAMLVKGTRAMAYGTGLLLGIAGGRYEEYRKIHGT